MGSGITAPGSGITTLGIGISGVFLWIKDKAFWINKILRDRGSKFSSRLEPGIKNLGKITGSAMKKYTSLRPCYLFYNRPNNFSSRTLVDPSCIFCGFFRVSRYGIINQLFSYPSLAAAKRLFLVFLDRFKV